MGIDFDYEIYVHRRDVGRFLTAVSELCDRPTSRSTTMLLPDGTAVSLPCTYGFADKQVVELTVALADRSGRDFDLCLCFPVDEPLRAYRDVESDAAAVGRVWPDGSSRVALGYIYLRISGEWSILPDHWRFRFMPAISSQGKLFLSSPSIRETFATLALSTGASLCLLASGLGGPEIIVSALGHRVSTRVPGPCLLWAPRGSSTEAFQELTSMLAGQPADPPRYIIGPEHPEFAAVIDSFAEYSTVASSRWTGP
ncbi:hypothetical protein [Actinoplanes sp. NPDC020271]|uniref:hypothetical protein n=1 Tax=Actinoplanes sp. NPDC020271 TaxID=3363896 RepID=UPI0037B52E5A